MKKLTWWGKVVRWYWQVIKYWWSHRKDPEYAPPTREEVLEFMRTGFSGEPVPLTRTCIGIVKSPPKN